MFRYIIYTHKLYIYIFLVYVYRICLWYILEFEDFFLQFVFGLDILFMIFWCISDLMPSSKSVVLHPSFWIRFIFLDSFVIVIVCVVHALISSCDHCDHSSFALIFWSFRCIWFRDTSWSSLLHFSRFSSEFRRVSGALGETCDPSRAGEQTEGSDANSEMWWDVIVIVRYCPICLKFVEAGETVETSTSQHHHFVKHVQKTRTRPTRPSERCLSDNIGWTWMRSMQLGFDLIFDWEKVSSALWLT